MNVLLVSLLLNMASCDKNNIKNVELINQQNLQEDPTINLQLNVKLNNSDISTLQNFNGSIPIEKLWRKRGGCKKVGICKWGTKVFEPTDPFDVSYLTGREVLMPIILDSYQNIRPVILQYTSDPTFLDSEDIKFYIDEDLTIDVTNDMNLPFDKIIIRENTIPYNPSIGNFGGYVINIEGLSY